VCCGDREQGREVDLTAAANAAAAANALGRAAAQQVNIFTIVV